MNARVVRWLGRGLTAAALGWSLYSLCAWVAPGILCLAGSGRQCAEASMRAMEKEPPDAAAAWRHANRGCARGDATSCNNVGVCYQRGTGIAKNLAQASRQYQKACDMGSGLACENYAELPRQGELSPLADPQRLRAYARACELDYGPGCRRAISLSKDSRKALEFARNGCARSDAPSCGFKALLLASAQPQSDEAHRSVVELTAQCSADEPSACAALGMLYGAGASVARDLSRAKELLARACPRGNEHACSMKDNDAMLGGLPELLPRLVQKIAHSELEVGP